MTAIELSWPPRILSPNGRGHHMAKHRAKKAARAEGFSATKAAKVGLAAGDVPITIKLTFHPKTKNLPDADNAVASCKAYLDGIADALGVDDSCFRLAAPVIAEPVRGGKVVVEIGGGECDRLDTLHDVDEVRREIAKKSLGAGHGDRRPLAEPIACRSGRGA